MTDEEKAEEYAIAVCFNCKKNISKNACNRENYENCCNYVNSYLGFYHGYKAGLSDREQENAELKRHLEAQAESIASYEHDNAELKAEIELLRVKEKNVYEVELSVLHKIVDDIEKENEELTATHESDKEAIEIIMKQWVEEREKMKCCGNCRHRSEDGECEDTPWWDKCYKWELAE